MSYYVEPFDGVGFPSVDTRRGEFADDLERSHAKIFPNRHWDGYQINPGTTKPYTVLFGRAATALDLERVAKGEAYINEFRFRSRQYSKPFIAVGRSGELYAVVNATICHPIVGHPQFAVTEGKKTIRVKAAPLRNEKALKNEIEMRLRRANGNIAGMNLKGLPFVNDNGAPATKPTSFSYVDSGFPFKLHRLGYASNGDVWEIVELNGAYDHHFHKLANGRFIMMNRSGKGRIFLRHRTLRYDHNSNFNVPANIPHAFATQAKAQTRRKARTTRFISIQDKPIKDFISGAIDFYSSRGNHIPGTFKRSAMRSRHNRVAAAKRRQMMRKNFV